MAKRKRPSLPKEHFGALLSDVTPSEYEERVSDRSINRLKSESQRRSRSLITNPNANVDVVDGSQALRASPSADAQDERFKIEKAAPEAATQTTANGEADSLKLDDSDSPLSEIPELVSSPEKNHGKSGRKANGLADREAKPAKQPSKSVATTNESQTLDSDAEVNEEADEEEIQAALTRPPPVNSDFLPLPWKGRLGYACLCTYLRFSNPPVFSSRTCRIASILENRHPLRDSNAPPHPTKNRPDKDQPASIERGQTYVESLGLANARDIIKMLRWNNHYGIKFMRLSSEMFPFASHEEYGYPLAPFASGVLSEAGSVAAGLGHRLTTHPGQFTQLGSPRQQVISNAIRDLEYHAEMLSLLKLPPQQDRDAVMILHLGGIFGDKAATLDRFRENYKKLSQNIKDRLVLENDDVSWSVHDLLPLCEELNIPMVLDFHHHNIIFDADHIREGTKDIMDLFPRILATWERKNITPKMHYSEPTPAAITKMQRRKHSPRVATLPPCPPTMDLMIEAKDKEQAVFELMRTFKLPGFDRFNDMIPHVRKDDNKPIKAPKKATPRKKGKKPKTEDENDDAEDQESIRPFIPEDDVGMGGPEGRVYWPPGMEHWLRPVKKVIKPKESKETKEPAKAAQDRNASTPAKKRKRSDEPSQTFVESASEALPTSEKTNNNTNPSPVTPTPASRKKPKNIPSKNPSSKKKKTAKTVPTPSTSDNEAEAEADAGSPPESSAEHEDRAQAAKPTSKKRQNHPPRRTSGRAKKVSYAEGEAEGDDAE